ncbi:hypothetical protein N7476_000314 [Penicillium atrosanguineum]|uniref:Uncharacterized protein n=1 Tax=Penicillium atrosanguineum TaxID=1132637 RepID=A0A9W9UBN0_9EURO|nr:hypothetical protein N7476_000314 [Penicillium atrosanguineum]
MAKVHYTVMLSKPPTELLYWACEFLQKEYILNLCLVCHRTNSVFTEALFLCLISEKIPPLCRAVTSPRHCVNIDAEYAGKNTLLLAIELRYPQAVDLILRYKPNVRYCCDFGGPGPLSLAIIRRNTAIVERILEFQEIDVNDRCSKGLPAIVYALKHRKYCTISCISYFLTLG